MGCRTLDLTPPDPQPGFVTSATATEDDGFDPNAVVLMEVHFSGSAALENLMFSPR